MRKIPLLKVPHIEHVRKHHFIQTTNKPFAKMVMSTLVDTGSTFTAGPFEGDGGITILVHTPDAVFLDAAVQVAAIKYIAIFEQNR